MRRFIIGLFALIGMITIVILVALGWSFHRLAAPSLPSLAAEEAVVLSLTLGDEALPEQPHGKGWRALVEGHPLSVHTVVDGLAQAAKDPRVKGVLLTIEDSALKTATTQEIRDALKAFKATGKFIYAYADTFGEFSNGTSAYYLAAAATKIWLMPLGSLNLTGLMVEVPFARKALDDWKLQPEMGRREDYKGFVESLTQADFTPPYRENMQRLLETMTTQIVADIAMDRGLDASRVRQLLNTAPHEPKEALAAKLVDEIGYKDQVKDAIEKAIGKKPAYYLFTAYIHTLKHAPHGDQIAIIYGEGMIMKGKARPLPLSEEGVLEATEVAKSIREAGEDKAIKAIVVRIDSGGGSAIASDLIAQEIEKAKGKKPVIVSMANAAASGGYWIACHGTKIVAEPASITGSIGVFAGKIVTQGFWEHYGVHWGEVHSGDNAALWSTGQTYGEKGWQKLNERLDHIYATFLEKVSKGRNLPLEKVRDIAKGQVWTGAEAKEKGLVDALGGLTTALEIAKKEVGLAADAPVTLLHLPAPKPFWELLLDRSRSPETEILARYPSLRLVLSRLERLLAQPRLELKLPGHP